MVCGITLYEYEFHNNVKHGPKILFIFSKVNCYIGAAKILENFARRFSLFFVRLKYNITVLFMILIYSSVESRKEEARTVW